MATHSSILAWKNPMDRGAWQATVHGVRKELDTLSWLNTHTHTRLQIKRWKGNSLTVQAKWLSGEALQIAEKRREAKDKGEKERYTHLNTEFERIARRHKKAFPIDQCKEIEENNRMGKTRDLFKKISETKGTFLAKIGTIKDRHGIDLTE